VATCSAPCRGSAPSPTLPLSYLVTAVAAFVLACAAVPALAPELAGHYYHPRITALVHTVTLGWITLSIMGASYQLIPIVLARPVWSQRLARWQFWLINVGGEGQLFIGALFATWGAINFNNLPAWLFLPWISILGFLGGGLWASISGFLRAKGWASETISTLLMNYVAILLVNFFVFGPWKDPESANYPQSIPFPDAAILPSFLTQ